MANYKTFSPAAWAAFIERFPKDTALVCDTLPAVTEEGVVRFQRSDSSWYVSKGLTRQCWSMTDPDTSTLYVVYTEANPAVGGNVYVTNDTSAPLKYVSSISDLTDLASNGGYLEDASLYAVTSTTIELKGTLDVTLNRDSSHDLTETSWVKLEGGGGGGDVDLSKLVRVPEKNSSGVPIGWEDYDDYTVFLVNDQNESSPGEGSFSLYMKFTYSGSAALCRLYDASAITEDKLELYDPDGYDTGAVYTGLATFIWNFDRTETASNYDKKAFVVLQCTSVQKLRLGSASGDEIELPRGTRIWITNVPGYGAQATFVCDNKLYRGALWAYSDTIAYLNYYSVIGGSETDSALSDTSTNPVQNAVIKAALDTKQGTDLSSAVTIRGTSCSTVEEAINALATFVNKFGTNYVAGQYNTNYNQVDLAAVSLE